MSVSYELILLYAVGFKAKDIIEMGYPRNTAWRYNKYFKQAQYEVVKKLGGKK